MCMCAHTPPLVKRKRVRPTPKQLKYAGASSKSRQSEQNRSSNKHLLPRVCSEACELLFLPVAFGACLKKWCAPVVVVRALQLMHLVKCVYLNVRLPLHRIASSEGRVMIFSCEGVKAGDIVVCTTHLPTMIKLFTVCVFSKFLFFSNILHLEILDKFPSPTRSCMTKISIFSPKTKNWVLIGKVKIKEEGGLVE